MGEGVRLSRFDEDEIIYLFMLLLMGEAAILPGCWLNNRLLFFFVFVCFGAPRDIETLKQNEEMMMDRVGT